MFVTYQDFKASTTVEGILQFIGTLSGDDLPQIDAEQLLAQMTLQTEGDKNCVTIPLQLGDISAEIKLFATKVEEKYTFTHATATLGDVSLSIVPCSQWTMPQQTGEYPEILGLTQLIQNGAISATATVGDISADVMFDIASCALHVKMGQLTATLKDNVLFAQLGQAKVGLDVDSIPQLLQLFQPLLGENIQMPQLSLQDVLAALSSVTAQKTNDGVKFSATFEDIYFEALLVSDAEGWMLHSVTVQLSDITATLQPSQNQLPQIGIADEYTDVTQMAKQFAPSIVSLLQAQGYSAEIDAVANVDGKDFRIAGNILIDGTGNVSAVADIFENGVTLANADIVFADGKIFLQINGVKAAFELPQQGETIPLQTGNATLDAIIGEITRIVNKIQSATVASGLCHAVGQSYLQQRSFANNGKRRIYRNRHRGPFAVDCGGKTFRKNRTIAHCRHNLARHTGRGGNLATGKRAKWRRLRSESQRKRKRNNIPTHRRPVEGRNLRQCTNCQRCCEVALRRRHGVHQNGQCGNKPWQRTNCTTAFGVGLGFLFAHDGHCNNSQLVANKPRRQYPHFIAVRR